MTLTQSQLDNILFDYGLIYVNYGEVDQRLIGPTRGGVEFVATANIRDVEFDGRLGKSKGSQVIDEINASLKFNLLDSSLANMAMALPGTTYDAENTIIKSGVGGVIPTGNYLTNVTVFGKVTGGGYKKITLKNSMGEGDFSLKMQDKSEAEVPLEIWAHWDPTATAAAGDLYTIEDVANITGDTTAPTVTTTPADAATGVVISANLTALFDEDVRATDIIADNFTLLKVSDGTIVAGALTYNVGARTATFNPTANLDAGTAYIWVIARVRDIAGNVMARTVTNFTTA
jgi:hypothetical protein